MSKVRLLAITGAIVVALAALGSGIVAQAQTESVTVDLGPGRDGTQTGTAVLTAMGDQTEVVIDAQPGEAGVEQPVHIHVGSCPGVEAVAYPLTNVVDGASTTVVDASLSSLTGGGYAINLHKSVPEAQIYTSCGNIQAAAAPAADEPATTLPAAGSGGLIDGGGGVSPWLYVVIAAGVLLTAGGGVALALSRRRA